MPRHDSIPRSGLLLLLVVVAVTQWCHLAAAAISPDDAAAEARPLLGWAPPALENPARVSPTSGYWLKLDPRRDYIVEMPEAPFTAPGGLRIQGGRNVVLVGGEVRLPGQPPDTPADQRKAVRLKEQTGTVHIEGLLLGGDITEGIQLDQRHGSTVQIENVRVETIRARDEVGFSDNHPDLIQTWAGPDRLRVDRLTGTSDYQGLFLHPNQYGGSPPRCFEFRHVNVAGTPTARYLWWRVGSWPLALSDVWVQPAPGRSMQHTLWPHGDPTWSAIRQGSPPGGDFVPAGVAGASYVSPGYAHASGC